PELEPEENDGDDEKSEGGSIDYPTSEEDNDGDDDGDDLLEDDADNEDEEESSDSEEEEEEHLAPTVPSPAQYSSVSESDETEPFEEGETAATPPPFGYRIAAKISVQPHILIPFRSESKIDRLLAIPTPPLSPVSLTSYTLPPLLTPFPIYTPLPTSSFLVPSSIPSSSGSESIPEADIPLQIMDYCQSREVHTSTLVTQMEALRREIRPTLTIAESRRGDGKLIGGAFGGKGCYGFVRQGTGWVGVWGLGKNSPWGFIKDSLVKWQFESLGPSGKLGEKVLLANFGKKAQLVLGLWSLTFDGFGFDLWARIVPRLGFFDKQGFIVDLFLNILLPDLALILVFILVLNLPGFWLIL
nr:hypothetical protein [Tanacetum cinerariifolium]